MIFNELIKVFKKVNCKVVIAEQNTLEDKTVINDGYTHMYIKIDSDQMCKALLLNKACEKIDTEYIWFCDADVHLNFNDILPRINGQNVIKPFTAIVTLDIEQTDKFIKEGNIDLSGKDRIPIMNVFGTLTFIIKNECFKRIGGFNPAYVGHGFQDLDIASRILDYYNVEEFDCYGLHLYHERPIEDGRNFKLFDKLF